MENQNTFVPHDCQGTCKTPVGCTCARANKKALETMGTETGYAVATKSCGCGSGGGCSSGGSCSCKSGGGCSCKSGGGCSKKGGSCCSGTNKLEVYNWLQDLPEVAGESQMVEVQFKNTRKGYYLNSNNVEIYRGDIVAVEASPGHDIGEVTLTGKLVQLQMLKNNYRGETKRIYRIAKQTDIDKWNEARAKEHKTMLRAREIAEELSLGMKISDVEFQGDGNKAIFYYIADERVDFRQLIKVYASEFRVKIEMKQIGARQEAGRVGGIGPCGRELCCSSSMSNFVSVSTSAARLQDIPLNPQKLAGQCGKLKCCLNFEVDTYVEAQRKLPSREVVLETKDASFYHFKTDILSGEMTYSTDRHFAANLVTLPKDRVYEIIRINKQGGKPTHLATEPQEQAEKVTSHDILQENITRFDNNSGNSNRNNKKKKFVKNRSENGGQGAPNNQGGNNRPDNNRQAGNNKQANPNPNARPNNNNRPENNNQQNQNKNNNHKNNRNDRNRHNRNGKPDQKKPDA
ncbi:PSP1 domain-containing protein [Dysgonomonas termitidis]|uniref:Stage 0 sporulation family protein n=1 Tax=Dysgonomonas termitidis TaxID=1516126 RepID=A0ABV9L0F9_9BACT